MKRYSLLMLAAALAVTAFMHFTGYAFAQEVAAAAADSGGVVIAAETPAPTVVDLAPAVKSVDSIIYVVLAGLAAFIFTLLQKIPLFNKLVTKEQYQKLVDPLLDEAVAYGVGKLENADWLKVDTKNEAIATAIKYVLEHGGDLLGKFGISEDALRQKLEAKLVANGWDTQPGKWEKPAQS